MKKLFHQILVIVISFNLIFLSVPIVPFEIPLDVLSTPLAYGCEESDSTEPTNPETTPDETDDTSGEDTPSGCSTCEDGPLAPADPDTIDLLEQEKIEFQTVSTSAGNLKNTISSSNTISNYSTFQTSLNTVISHANATENSAIKNQASQSSTSFSAASTHNTNIQNWEIQKQAAQDELAEVTAAVDLCTGATAEQQQQIDDLNEEINSLNQSISTASTARAAAMGSVKSALGVIQQEANTQITNINNEIKSLQDAETAFNAAFDRLLQYFQISVTSPEATLLRQQAQANSNPAVSNGAGYDVGIELYDNKGVYEFTVTSTGAATLKNPGQLAGIRVINHLVRKGARLEDLIIHNTQLVGSSLYRIEIVETRPEAEIAFYISPSVFASATQISGDVVFTDANFGICIFSCQKPKINIDLSGVFGAGVDFKALEKAAKDLMNYQGLDDQEYAFSMNSFSSFVSGTETTHVFSLSGAGSNYSYRVVQTGTGVYSAAELVTPAELAVDDLAEKLNLTNEQVDQINSSVQGSNVTLNLFGVTYTYDLWGKAVAETELKIAAINHLRGRVQGITPEAILNSLGVNQISLTGISASIVLSQRRSGGASLIHGYQIAYTMSNGIAVPGAVTVSGMSYQTVSGGVPQEIYLSFSGNFLHSDPLALEAAVKWLKENNERTDSLILNLYEPIQYDICPPTTECWNQHDFQIQNSELRFDFRVNYYTMGSFRNQYLVFLDQAAFLPHLVQERDPVGFGNGRLVFLRNSQNERKMIKVQIQDNNHPMGYRTVGSYDINSYTVTDDAVTALPASGAAWANLRFHRNADPVKEYFTVEILSGGRKATDRYEIGEPGLENGLRILSRSIIQVSDDFPVQDERWTYSESTGALLSKKITRIGLNLHSMVYIKNFNPSSETAKVTRLGGGNDCPDTGGPLRMCTVTVVEFEIDQAILNATSSPLSEDGILNSVEGTATNGDPFGIRYNSTGLAIEYWTKNLVVDAAKNYIESFVLFIGDQYHWMDQQDVLSRMEIISFSHPTGLPSNIYDVRIRFLGQEFTVRMDAYVRDPYFASAAYESQTALTAVKYLLAKEVLVDDVQIISPASALQGGWRVDIRESRDNGLVITHRFFGVLNQGEMFLRSLGADYRMPNGTHTFRVAFCDAPCADVNIRTAYDYQSSPLNRLHDPHAIFRAMQLIANKFPAGTIDLNLREYEEVRGDSPMGPYTHYILELDTPERMFGIELLARQSYSATISDYYEIARILYEVEHTPFNRAKDALADLLKLTLDERNAIQEGETVTSGGKLFVTVSYRGSIYTFEDRGRESPSLPTPGTHSMIQAIHRLTSISYLADRGDDVIEVTGPGRIKLNDLRFNQGQDITAISPSEYDVALTQERGAHDLKHRYRVQPGQQLVMRQGMAYRGTETDFNGNEITYSDDIVIPWRNWGGIDRLEYDGEVIAAAINDLIDNQHEIAPADGIRLTVTEYHVISVFDGYFDGRRTENYVIRLRNEVNGNVYEYAVDYDNWRSTRPYRASFKGFAFPFTTITQIDFSDGEVVIAEPQPDDDGTIPFGGNRLALFRVDDPDTLDGKRTIKNFVIDDRITQNPLTIYPHPSNDEDWDEIRFITHDDPSQDYYQTVENRGSEVQLKTDIKPINESGNYKFRMMKETVYRPANDKTIQIAQYDPNQKTNTMISVSRSEGLRTFKYYPETGRFEVRGLGGVEFSTIPEGEPAFIYDEENYPGLNVIQSVRGITGTATEGAGDGEQFEIRIVEGPTPLDGKIIIKTEKDLAAEYARDELAAMLTDWITNDSQRTFEYEAVLNAIVSDQMTSARVDPWDGCFGWQLPGQDCSGTMEGRAYTVEIQLLGNSYRFHVSVDGDNILHSRIDPAMETAIEAINNVRAREGFRLEDIGNVTSVLNPSRDSVPNDPLLHRYKVNFTAAGSRWEYDMLRYYDPQTNGLDVYRYRGIKQWNQASGQLLKAVYFSLFNTRHVEVNYSGYPGIHDDSIESVIRFNVFNALGQPPKVIQPGLVNSIHMEILEYRAEHRQDCATHPDIGGITCEQVNFVLASDPNSEIQLEGTTQTYRGHYFIAETRRNVWPTQNPTYDQVKFVSIEKTDAGKAKKVLRDRLSLDVNLTKKLEHVTPPAFPLTIGLYGLRFEFSTNQAGVSLISNSAAVVSALIRLKEEAQRYSRSFNFENIEVEHVQATGTDAAVYLRESFSGGITLLHRYDTNGTSQLILQDYLYRDTSGREINIQFEAPVPANIDSHAIQAVVKDLAQRGEPVSVLILKDYEEHGPFTSPVDGSEYRLYGFNMEASEEMTYEYSVFRNFYQDSYLVTLESFVFPYDVLRMEDFGEGRAIVAAYDDGSHQLLIQEPSPQTLGQFRTIQTYPLAAPAADLSGDVITLDLAPTHEAESVTLRFNAAPCPEDCLEVLHLNGPVAVTNMFVLNNLSGTYELRRYYQLRELTGLNKQETFFEYDGDAKQMITQEIRRQVGERQMIFEPEQSHIRVRCLQDCSDPPDFDEAVSNLTVTHNAETQMIEVVTGIRDSDGERFEIRIGDTIEVIFEKDLAAEYAENRFRNRLGLGASPGVEILSSQAVPEWDSCAGWPEQHLDCSGTVDGRSYKVELQYGPNTYEYHVYLDTDMNFRGSLDPEQNAAIAAMQHLSQRYSIPFIHLSIENDSRSAPFDGFTESDTEAQYFYPLTFRNTENNHSWTYVIKRLIEKATGEVNFYVWAPSSWAVTHYSESGQMLDKIYTRTTRGLDVMVKIPQGTNPPVDVKAVDGAMNYLLSSTAEWQVTSADSFVEIRNYRESETNSGCHQSSSWCTNINFELVSRPKSANDPGWIYVYEDMTRTSGNIYQNENRYTAVRNDVTGNAKLKLYRILDLSFRWTLDSITAVNDSGWLNYGGNDYYFTVTRTGTSAQGVPIFSARLTGINYKLDGAGIQINFTQNLDKIEREAIFTAVRHLRDTLTDFDGFSLTLSRYSLRQVCADINCWDEYKFDMAVNGVTYSYRVNHYTYLEPAYQPMLLSQSSTTRALFAMATLQSGATADATTTTSTTLSLSTSLSKWNLSSLKSLSLLSRTFKTASITAPSLISNSLTTNTVSSAPASSPDSSSTSGNATETGSTSFDINLSGATSSQDSGTIPEPEPISLQTYYTPLFSPLRVDTTSFGSSYQFSPALKSFSPLSRLSKLQLGNKRDTF